MKVIVNSRFLTQPMTGVQQYALKLSMFLKSHLGHEVIFVSPKGIQHIHAAEELKVEQIGNTRGFFWEQVELPFWLKKEGSPLLINFGNVAPQYYSNQIVTIHDLATLEHPEWFSSKFARAYKFMIPQVVKNAKKVIAVSHFTKRRITELLNIPQERIEVIYNSTDIPVNLPWVQQVKPYFLSVGSFSGRKNFSTLVKAFQQADLPNFQLKIRGDMEDIFREEGDAVQMIKQDARIHSVEPLNYQAYLDLMRNATTLINTSIYEGFGMPNLEAMSLGVPIICSDIEVFKEVSGECATYIDPHDLTGLADLLRGASKKTLTESERNRLIQRAHHFKTEVEGKKLVNLISKCLNEV